MLTHSAQNDNVDFFAAAAPCNPLGCFLSKARSNKEFKPLQTPPSRLCIAKSKFSMKRVPIKGGACKGLTALFCEIWLWIQSISSFLIFALNLGQNSSLIFGLPRRFCENGSQWRHIFVILTSQHNKDFVILSLYKRLPSDLQGANQSKKSTLSFWA